MLLTFRYTLTIAVIRNIEGFCSPKYIKKGKKKVNNSQQTTRFPYSTLMRCTEWWCTILFKRVHRNRLRLILPIRNTYIIPRVLQILFCFVWVFISNFQLTRITNAREVSKACASISNRQCSWMKSNKHETIFPIEIDSLDVPGFDFIFICNLFNRHSFLVFSSSLLDADNCSLARALFINVAELALNMNYEKFQSVFTFHTRKQRSEKIDLA